MIVEWERAGLVESEAVDGSWIYCRAFIEAAIIIGAVRAVLLFGGAVPQRMGRMVVDRYPHAMRRIIHEVNGRAELYSEALRREAAIAIGNDRRRCASAAGHSGRCSRAYRRGRNGCRSLMREEEIPAYGEHENNDDGDNDIAVRHANDS